MRPIVSMVNSLEYNLAKYLIKLIKSSIPVTHSVRSNIEVIEKLKNFEFQKGDYLVSDDVV